MGRNSNLVVIIATIFVIFSSANSALALQEKQLQKYPDYAYQFCGKDKCEGFNRKIFSFNLKVNKFIIRPVNIIWASVMPKYGMDRIKSVYNNSTYPVRFVSSIVQKDYKTAKSETKRFLTNTTLGVGGLYDPALTKFKIEPRQEDMAQALAHTKIGQGPFLVLPIVAQGNLRDLFGELLNIPLNPSSYVVGPVAAIVKGVLSLNNTAYLQPLAKMLDENFADPYEVAKKLTGIEKYIKNSNLDRKEVLAKKVEEQNLIEVRESSSALTPVAVSKPNPKADINLNDFNPQDPLIDSMRTALFDNQKINPPSIWTDLSLWNKNFNKKIKISSISLHKNRDNYRYRYILQKKQNFSSCNNLPINRRRNYGRKINGTSQNTFR